MIKNEKFERIKLSKDEYKQLLIIEKKTSNKKLLIRVQAFKLLYKNWKYSQIAQAIDVTNNTITNWIKIYNENGLNNLFSLKYKGSKAKLTKEQFYLLKEKTETGSFTYAKEASQFIQETFNVSYHLRHVQKLLKKNF